MIKVLFVCSGNTGDKNPGAVTFNQAESLRKNGVDVHFFLITEKGLLGYLRSIPKLTSVLKKNKFDIVHAHYSLSAYVATMARAKPLVVSLMGSDAQGKGISKYVLKFFSRFWDTVIVKSADLKLKSGIGNALIIANGVDFEKYSFIEKETARKKLELSIEKKYIIFLADPSRPEKNYKLAEEASRLVKKRNTELKVVYDISHEDTRYYFYASDVILLTSLHEGSPNVIKEAMACNCSVVATDVGDIKELISELKGCYITEFTPGSVAASIEEALRYNTKTDARQRLVDLSLESNSVAKKIIELYKQILN